MREWIRAHKLISRVAIAAACVMAVAAIVLFIYYWGPYMVAPISGRRIAEVKQSGAKKLMIVAHPDDEALWGGLHLLDDKYYVVCITNGRNRTRADEFYKALEASGSDGVILSYPDKVFSKRDDWSKVYDGILRDIEKIVEAKDWEQIVTHNPKGEYGHIHHIMTSRIVTGICKDKDNTEILYYFGKYYRKKEMRKAKKNMESCEKEALQGKENLLKLYLSQKDIVAKFAHMNAYENWIAYDDWE